MSNKFWTAAKVSELRRLAESGLIVAEMASALGTTRNAVIGQAHRSGIPLLPRGEACSRLYAIRRFGSTRLSCDRHESR